MSDTNVVDTTAVDTAENEGMGTQAFGESPASQIQKPTEVKKPSPAQDLRDVQALLVMGIYPGNVAPQVVKAYQLLEQMAVSVENESKDTK